MGRYEKKHSDNSVEHAVTAIITGGLSLLIGMPEPETKTVITDTETGITGEGYGSSKTQADDNAWEDLQNKK